MAGHVRCADRTPCQTTCAHFILKWCRVDGEPGERPETRDAFRTEPALVTQVPHLLPQALAGAAGMQRGEEGCKCKRWVPKEEEAQKGTLLGVSDSLE